MAMTYDEWEVWAVLRERKLVSKRLSDALNRKVSTQKFYTQRWDRAVWPAPPSPELGNLHTIEYVRDWVYIFWKAKEAWDQGKQLPENLKALAKKYHLQPSSAIIEHPDWYAWYEVTGIRLDDLKVFSSRLNMFGCEAPIEEEQVLRSWNVASLTDAEASLIH